MKTLFFAWRFLWSRPLGAALNLLLLSLGLASITFLLLVSHQLSQAFERDLAGIDVVVAGVATPVWSKLKDLSGSTTGQAWKPIAMDLSPWAGKVVQVKAWFDQVKYDTSNKAKLGFVLDEVEVVGKCP